MASVSQFSTAENFAKLTTGLEKINHAIDEAKLAQQAGVPSADIMLATAEATRTKILQLLNTYFPGGTAPAGS